MNPDTADTDLWFSFLQTFGMLFLVLAFFMVVFYLFRKISGSSMAKGGKSLISVLAVHHLAPKEKLVLVAVQDAVFLLGVTPSGINRLATLDNIPEDIHGGTSGGFPDLLGKILNQDETPRKKDAYHQTPGNSDRT
ncbi:MAG TPA: flagellar biosynthetic protein FliO [Desulfobacteraceae bacterium]|nr:flagellar biosynthetic protein FliO [Desulfobacteraceae bacterium]